MALGVWSSTRKHVRCSLDDLFLRNVSNQASTLRENQPTTLSPCRGRTDSSKRNASIPVGELQQQEQVVHPRHAQTLNASLFFFFSRILAGCFGVGSWWLVMAALIVQPQLAYQGCPSRLLKLSIVSRVTCIGLLFTISSCLVAGVACSKPDPGARTLTYPLGLQTVLAC